MFDTETFVTLFKYNDWADEILFDAMGKLDESVLYKETSTLFKSMVGTLNHNYQVDLIWRAHLTGEKTQFKSRREILHPQFPDIVAAQKASNRWFIEWASNQTAQALAEAINFNFVSGEPGVMRCGDMLLHIINHKTYHRGWISEMFFENGYTPPENDLSIYLTSPSLSAAA